ncbi:unnamed protein product [Rotaria sordida]|uniref:Cadherin domain-containing protein n=1 Tax=Rotaria sordida TaxID=392033 RepID=A0A815IPD3_9BILA|nr:unnamed protein product [Rotaria sordida]CAF1367587.1 unnamed protein product [Rotaria sordida]
MAQTQGQLCTLQFLPALQIITMPENTKPTELVTRLQITGTQSEIATRLIYNSPDVKTNGTDYFTLNFTDLYLRYSLDYEWWTSINNPNPFRFIVECKILTNQSIYNIDFQLDLIDVNDNPPRFNQSLYKININETTPIGTIIPTLISAYDLDSSIYGVFSYHLLSNSSSYTSYFQLVNSTNANLVLMKSLDYNSMIPNFNLTIIVQDNLNASLFSQAIISIHIIDVDNLNPTFLSASYNLNISITTIAGSQVTPNEGRIFAYDQDLGINTTILYSILTSNIYLLIDNNTGVLTLQSDLNSTMQFDLLIKAEQVDNKNRSITTILHVNVYELNIYPPNFLNLPYIMIGYATNNLNQIPIFNGSINDNDMMPRLNYGYICNTPLLNLNIKKISVRNFQIQPIYSQTLPICRPCLCTLNVSDGLYSTQTNLNILLYNPVSFSMNSYLFSTDYPLNNPSIIIGSIQIINDNLCSVQYSLVGQSSSLFSISQTGNITWSNPSNLPTQEAYQFQVIVKQNCSSLIMNISTDIIITIRNFPSSILTTTTTTISSSRIDNSTIYAIIGGVGAFILIVIAILFIIIYYRIQRAKHRVPPFFKIRKHSPAQGLSFFKSKSPLSNSSPYTLGVRDDDSSNSSSDQTSSSPMNNRLLSGHYKVSELPVNTTIEELLSSYDNRSTSSSSSSSGIGDHGISTNIGSFRTTIRETNDHQQLDTINEDIQWVNNNNQQQQQQLRRLNGLRHQIIPDDSMDIISESHEVDNRLRQNTNACLTCLNSNSINHVCSCSCSLLSNTSIHLLLSSSSSSSSGSTTTVAACQQQTTTTTTTVESSISGTTTDNGTSGSTLLHQQFNTRNTLSRNMNEYLTVFV